MFIRCQIQSNKDEHDKAQILINLDNVESIGPLDDGGSAITMMNNGEDDFNVISVHQSFIVLVQAIDKAKQVIQP